MGIERISDKAGRHVLNPRHREGRHKARVFESSLGITLANGDVLRQTILSAAGNSDDAEALGNNGHGEIYILRVRLETQKGSATVMTVVDYPRRRRLSAVDHLLYTLNMLGEMKMNDVVALLQDVPAKHFESGRARFCVAGRSAPVVMSYPDGAYEVEFADRDGRAFAILSLRPAAIDGSPRHPRFRCGIGAQRRGAPHPLLHQKTPFDP